MTNSNRNFVPYTTKSGVQIGIAYQPPAQMPTQEGEFIQSVLLGDNSQAQNNKSMAAYAVVVLCVFLALAVLS